MDKRDSKSLLDAWHQESLRLLEIALSALEVALNGLPCQYPSSFEFWFGKVNFSSCFDTERVEREICDAFFLRLKSIVETQMKRFPLRTNNPNWKSWDKLLHSLGVNVNVMELTDRNELGKFCAIRNCIAHNDGRVDEELNMKIPDLKRGSDIWMTRDQIRNWFQLSGRIIQAIYAGHDQNPS
jgi:hypothetical protein